MSDSEEEILVFVEFKNPVPPLKEGAKIKMIGLETNEPIVQCDKLVFKGNWLDSVETNVLMGEKKTSDILDPAFDLDLSKQYECRYTTNKVLQLESFVLTPKVKEPAEGNESLTEESAEEDVLVVDETIQE